MERNRRRCSLAGDELIEQRLLRERQILVRQLARLDKIAKRIKKDSASNKTKSSTSFNQHLLRFVLAIRQTSKQLTDAGTCQKLKQSILSAWNQVSPLHLDTIFCLVAAKNLLVSHHERTIIIRSLHAPNSDILCRHALDKTFNTYDCRFLTSKSIENSRDQVLILAAFQSEERQSLRFILYALHTSSATTTSVTLEQLDSADVFFSGTEQDLDMIDCESCLLIPSLKDDAVTECRITSLEIQLETKPLYSPFTKESLAKLTCVGVYGSQVRPTDELEPRAIDRMFLYVVGGDTVTLFVSPDNTDWVAAFSTRLCLSSDNHYWLQDQLPFSIDLATRESTDPSSGDAADLDEDVDMESGETSFSVSWMAPLTCVLPYPVEQKLRSLATWNDVHFPLTYVLFANHSDIAVCASVAYCSRQMTQFEAEFSAMHQQGDLSLKSVVVRERRCPGELSKQEWDEVGAVYSMTSVVMRSAGRIGIWDISNDEFIQFQLSESPSS